MFSELFIRRPILATVCSLLIILAGAVVIPVLPIARYPELAPPSVDMATQSVLVKAPLAADGQFRTDQFVRAHVVWSAAPGLTVPLVAVLRINGQFFVYVVEKGDNGTTIARQRPVQLGAVVGNDYVVLSGLKPGEQLITAGIQKIADGMPVNIGDGAPATAASGGR